MSTDTMIRGLFRALETSIHERLNMIEDVIRLTGSVGAEIPVAEVQQQSYSAPQDVERIRNLEDQIQTLSARLAALEQSGPAPANGQEVHVHQEGKGESLWIEPMRDLAIELPVAAAAPKPTPEVKSVPAPANSLVSVEEVAEVVSEEEEAAEAAEAAEEVVEEETEEVVEEDAEEEIEEAEEAAEEAAEEDEEEGVEIEEFEYKGKTYYRDGENQVYRMVDEELDETPIGTWDPERQRVLFRRPTSA